MKIDTGPLYISFCFDRAGKVIVLYPSSYEPRYEIVIEKNYDSVACKLNKMSSLQWSLKHMRTNYPWIDDEIHEFMLKNKLSKYFNFS